MSVTYTADGTQTVFSFPFDYLRKVFVFVEVNEETILVQGTDYSVSNKTVVFTTAPTTGTTVRIYRQTDTKPLVSWADASVLRAKDMTVQQIQELHILEETQEWARDYAIIRDGSEWNARNFPIKNVGDPEDSKDAATKNYVDEIVATISLNDGKVFTFDNVAEMLASALVPEVYAVTSGYYAVNDGGAAFYKIRSRTQTDIDDSGSVLFLNNGNVAELIIINGTVNVKQFGAKGDGEADDATAISNAVNCTKASRIIFPKATYALNSEIIFQRGNVTIIGNRATLFCLSSYVSNHVIWLRNNTSQMHNIVIDGLDINGNKANITNRVAGILAGSSATDPITDITIRNCYIHGLTGNGVHLDGYTVDNNPVQRGSRLLVDGCNIQNTRLAICQSGVMSTIRNCNLNNSDLENITVDNGCRNCEILNNTIGVHYGGAGNISTDGSDQTRIIGNRIDNGNDTTAATDLNNGITFNANTGPCNFCVVADNLILGNAKYGIWIKDKVADGKHIGCGYTTITGNVFTSNIEKDIQIDNVNGIGNTNLIIADNRYTTEEAIGINETN